MIGKISCALHDSEARIYAIFAERPRERKEDLKTTAFYRLGRANLPIP